MQRYYRVPDAAQLLGLNGSALYKIIRDGGLDTHHEHPLTITKQSMFANEAFCLAQELIMLSYAWQDSVDNVELTKPEELEAESAQPCAK